MRGEFIDVGGARIYYYAAGTRGVGEPVVLIHGLLTSSYLWHRVVPLVPPGHRVVVPDLIGCGRSDPPPASGQSADLSARGHAVRLVRLLDGLGIDRACLAAHDTGVSVALALLADRPDRVTRLCLVGAVTEASPPHTILANRLVGLSLGAVPFGALLALVRGALLHGYLHPALFARSVEHYLRPYAGAAGRTAVLAQLRTLTRRSALAPLPGTSTQADTAPPTVIVCGADDPVVTPAATRRVLAALRGSRLERVAGGHYSPEESPEQVAAALAGLLSPTSGPTVDA